MITLLGNKIKTLLSRDEGNVLIEFALLLPLLLLITFPAIDYANYILLQQKVIKSSTVLADSLSMSVPIDGTADPETTNFMNSQLTDQLIAEYAQLSDTLLSPFGSSTPGQYSHVIMSNIKREGAAQPRTTWRYDSQETPAFLMNPGQTYPQVPESLINAMGENENLIHVTVEALFSPISPDLRVLNIPFLTATPVGSSNFYRSRYGDLSNPASTGNVVQFACTESDYEYGTVGNSDLNSYQYVKVPATCECPGNYTEFAVEPPYLKVCYIPSACFGQSAEECYCEEGETYFRGGEPKCQIPQECLPPQRRSSYNNTCYTPKVSTSGTPSTSGTTTGTTTGTSTGTTTGTITPTKWFGE